MDEVLKGLIEKSAKKLDGMIPFNTIGAKMSNKALRLLFVAFEFVDGSVFKIILTNVIAILPEKSLVLVKAWLTAFVNDDYLVLASSSSEFVTELNLIPDDLVDPEDEAELYRIGLTILIKYVEKKATKAINA